MNLRRLKKEDISEIVKIHMVVFSEFFLTTLGKDFLAVFYRSCLRFEGTIGVGIYDENNRIEGFAVGSDLSKSYYKKIISKNLFRFFLIGTKLVFTKPRALIRLTRNLDKVSNEEDTGEYAELLSIGVNPKLKGKGYGIKLIEKFEKEVEERGQKELCLTTDYHDNDSVIKFYKKSGYEIFYKFIAYPEREMLKMKKRLKQ